MIQAFAITSDFKKKIFTNIDNINFTNYKWIWFDFNMPTENEILKLTEFFHFHPLAIEDCVHRLQRPKLDYYEGYTFFVTHELNNNDLIREEIYFFIGLNYIVSFHYHNSDQINQVWNRAISIDNIKNWDHYHCFYEVLDKIVDQYFPLIYEIEDELNTLEDNSEKNRWSYY